MGSLGMDAKAMNPHQLRRLLPQASASCIAANAKDYGTSLPEPVAPASASDTPKQGKAPEPSLHPVYGTPNDHQTHDSGPSAKLERHTGDAPLAAGQVQEATAGRILVRFVSVRKRLIDEDNLCEKFLCDCLRFSGAVPNDSPEILGIQTSQRKAEKGESEHTEITIEYP